MFKISIYYDVAKILSVTFPDMMLDVTISKYALTQWILLYRKLSKIYVDLFYLFETFHIFLSSFCSKMEGECGP